MKHSTSQDTTRYLIVSFVVFCILSGAYIICSRHEEFSLFEAAKKFDNLKIILPTISYHEVIQNQCYWPILSPLEPEIYDTIKIYRNIKCWSKMPEMAHLDGEGYLTITPPSDLWKSEKEFLRCVYKSLEGSLYPRHMSVQYGAEVELPINVPTIVKADQFVVTCFQVSKSGDDVIYQKSFVNFAPKIEIMKNKSPLAPANSLAPSVSLLILHSVSNNHFARSLPMTSEFLRDKKFLTFHMHNQIENGTMANLLPVFSGEEKRHGPVNIQEIKFIWDMMKERSCVTMWNDDIVTTDGGLFHRNDIEKALNSSAEYEGFYESPADFYLRPFHIHNIIHQKDEQDKQCMKDGRVKVFEYIDIWKEFQIVNKDNCHFSMNFLKGFMEDDIHLLGAIDEYLRDALEELHWRGIFNTTAMIIMADQGNQIKERPQSMMNAVEERSPFFSVRLPDTFVYTYDKQADRLRTNAGKLTTNRDVHQLLFDLANPEDFAIEAAQKYVQIDTETGKGISPLRYELSSDRNCSTTDIPPPLCLCMYNLTTRAESFRNTSSTYLHAMSIIEEEAMKHSCVKGVESHPYYTTLRIRTVRPEVLPLPNQKVNSTEFTGAIEFIDLGFELKLDKRPYKDFLKPAAFGTARLKHYMDGDIWQLATPPYVDNSSFPCFMKNLDTFCERCYYSSLLT